jgi:putative ABC transport system substrate-binding protein
VRRRKFIAFLGGAAAWPFAVRGQEAGKPLIGFLGSESPNLWTDRLVLFYQALRETGFVENLNVTTEYRWAQGQYDRLPALAAELANRQVTVMVTAANSAAALAAKAATTTIPIVFVIGVDPVEIGLVASLERPAGNVTGVTVLSVELAAKRLELLHELTPAASTIAVMVNPNDPTAKRETKQFQDAARIFGAHVQVLEASNAAEIEEAFKNLGRLQAGGLVMGAGALISSQQPWIAMLSLRYAIPTIHQFRDFVAAGGLMGYGANAHDAWRLAAAYTGRILKGEKPADLPVQQATKVGFSINLKTAKALGLTIPPSLLARADEVIE